ncbi:MAG: hypothetical protein PHS60_03225 [Zavarzinia sp.]|nr:hypothetical protein [Zavarzinia sp.]
MERSTVNTLIELIWTIEEQLAAVRTTLEKIETAIADEVEG